MGGGLLQLVAYGAQDVYLTGDPQITFFKIVYRRHTNFALESIEQTFNGNADFGRRVTCQISRNGDLINRIYLQVAFGAMDNLDNYTGLNLIKSIELEIGGQIIDKHYGDWMYIWNELSLPFGKREGYDDMVAKDPFTTTGRVLYIPLEFWFCRNPGLALPLIALQYHEVKINIELSSLLELSILGHHSFATGTMTSASLWVDYVFLDTDERRRFAQLSHEYLIEQVQFTGDETVVANTTNRVNLNFNHPVKEIIWVTQNSSTDNFGHYVPIVTAKLQLNGHDRFAQRYGKYFSTVQPYQHHTNIPFDININVYSFALKPEENQPSGSLNFSRIDTAVLQLTTGTANILRTYAVNYNVLRVMSGMAGLAYSN